MNKHHEKAKTLFAAHSKKDTLHFTSDGQAFFDKNPANNHAKTLDEKGVVTLERHEVTPVADVDADIDDDDLTEDELKEAADKKAADKAVADKKAAKETK